ncbi:MAG: biotin-dependent carboxyltransferase family protein [Chloroflexi bacterium]|nr:biotin-dependent carboxyltransferase family protein [Chloroflexota bacterium]
MSVETLEIVEPGMLTTVQDIGRYGYQRFGVPVSGAMDTFALRAANLLVGNEDGAACLEITVLGPRVRFLADTWIALAGGDLTPTLDGEPVPMWKSVEVSSGSVLSSKGVRDGMRAYLAVAGGIDVPLVMESRSTYLKGAIGGLAGRALRARDVLSALEPRGPFVERSLSDPPAYGHEHELRVVLGPQDDAFTQRGMDTFLGSKYTISMQSDRMGYRFDGPAIEHVKGPDIVSDGTPLGAAQVPGDGKPIVLLADRGTTGGYTKIATVISADISELAQAMPGDTVTFKAIEIEAAHDILRQQEERLDAIRSIGAPKPLSIVVEGEAFEVVDESGEAIVRSELGEGGARWTHRAKATVGGHTYEFEVTVKQVD